MATGRRFTGRRKVRLGDADRWGRLRLDALTRYAQDVSDDDTTDAGLAAEPGWVVRATTVDVLVTASLAEELTFTTFCSGVGRSWAERRLSVVGAEGARYEIATVWICINSTTGAPSKLTPQFLEIYGSAADNRRVSARLQNDKPPSDKDQVAIDRWPLRAVDFDVYGHVNNAAYWAVLEQWLTDAPDAPRRIRLEYGAGIEPIDSVAVARLIDESGPEAGSSLTLWWLPDGEGRPPAACAAAASIPSGLYDD